MTKKMEVHQTPIPGVFLIDAFVATDIRGNFVKDYSREAFKSNGIEHNLDETFYTSSYKGVIRAIHFQRKKQQPKLVRCINGLVYDVVVDLRKESPTYRQWVGYYLAGDGYKSVLVPSGCGHGYLVLEDSIVSYKCAERFYGEYDDGIMWDDPDIGIDWPLEKVGHQVILADKDKKLQSFEMFEKNYSKFL